jgi:formylglycine-generating enzyme required for sulfatase activity
VLRGGSWATDERVANPHFRNWDLPQRRQIFAGVRLAATAAECARWTRAGRPNDLR